MKRLTQVKNAAADMTSLCHSPFSRALRALLVSLTLALTVGLVACVYQVPIQQGNLLDPKDIEQVKVGMTQAQVRYVLGTPMVADTFTKDRWDYVYYLKKGQMRVPEQRHLVVYFDNGTVSKIEQRTPDKAAG
jgi:outer membrane protein assembly factor BamE